ncbi:MAG: HigA family addiction module antitoxin [Gammaproteobacteria bacterium]|nr:HigA family addiction module antitoxin [Gammaproteobacteria bacterium]
MAKLKNIHPRDILLHEFLQPMGISRNKLARDISVPPRRIYEIVLGKRAITADTALRLARYFGCSEKFWLGLQGDYDLEEASKKLGKTLNRISAVS